MIGMRDEVVISCLNGDAFFCCLFHESPTVTTGFFSVCSLPSFPSCFVSQGCFKLQIRTDLSKLINCRGLDFFVQPPFHSSSVKKFSKIQSSRHCLNIPGNIKSLDVLLHISPLKQTYYLENTSLKMSFLLEWHFVEGFPNLSQRLCCNLS